MASNFLSPQEKRNVAHFARDDEDRVEDGNFNPDWAAKVAGMVAMRQGDPNEVESTYFRNRESLENTGTSPEVQDWKENERLREDNITRQAAEDIIRDPEASDDDKAFRLRGLQDFADYSYSQPVNLRSSFRRQQGETEPTFSFGDDRVQTETLFDYESRLEAQDQIDELLAETDSDPNKGFFDLISGQFEGEDFLGKAKAKTQLEAEVVSMFAPAQWALKQKDVAEYVFPGITDGFLGESVGTMSAGALGEGVGDIRAEMRQRIRALPPRERVNAVRRVIEGVSSETGLLWKWGQNNIEAWETLQNLVGNIDATDAEINSDRVLDNIFGAVDVVPFVWGWAKKGFKGIKNAKTAAKAKDLHDTFLKQARDRAAGVPNDSPAGDMAATSPTRYETLSFNYVSRGANDVEFGKAWGATREGTAKEGTFPKGPFERINEKPDINDPLARGHLQRDRRFRFDPRDVDQVAATRKNRFEKLVRSKVVFPINKMQITSEVGDTIEYTASISSNQSRGFGTPQEAWNAAKAVVEDDTADVQILRKNTKTGEYEPIPRKEEELALKELEDWYKGQPHIQVKPKGDYIANIKGRHQIDLQDIEGRTDLVRGVSGRAAKFFDKDSWLADWMSKAGSVAFDQSSRLEKELVAKLRPVNALKRQDQEEVLSRLEKGEQEINADGTTGKWYTQEELNVLFRGDQKKIDAYNAVRDHQETLYYLTNDRFRSSLKAQGMNELKVGDNSFIGKPMKDVDDAARQVQQAYEPSRGIVNLRPEEVREIYEQGGRIGILNRAERVQAGPSAGKADTIETRFLIMRQGAEVNELPHFVLNRRGGYIPRQYNVSHIVGKKVNVRLDNGRVEEKIIPYKMGRNKAEAERARIRLEREEGDEFTVYGAREIRNDEELGAYADGMSEEFFEDHGMLYTGRRGQEVGHVDADMGARELQPIMDALETARRNTARHAALDPVVQSMERYMNKAYGDLFGTKGKISITGPAPNKPPKMDTMMEKEYNDMIAVRDHIRMLQGFNRPMSTKMSTDLNVAIGDALSDLSMSRVGDLPLMRHTLEGAANYVYAQAKVDPFRLAKTINFVRLIVMNPIRQFLLNSQQASMYYSLKPGYYNNGQAMREWTGLTVGLMGKYAEPNTMLNIFYKGQRNAMAKQLDMTLDEYEAFVDSFHQSGFVQAIDSHEYVAYMAVDNRSTSQITGMAKAARGAQNSVQTMIRMARRAGFDAGEFVNRSNAWLVARKEMIDQTGMKPGAKLDQYALDQIHGRANQLALNMNPAGKMQWQEGLTGMAFQFLSHVTKTMQVITPNVKLLGMNKIANKAYNNHAKRKIFIAQTALFGTGAFGLNELYRSIMETSNVNVPEWADEWIQEGLIGETINMAVRLGDAEDERSRIVYSEAYAPLSGAVVGNVPAMFLDSIMTMNMPIELLMGPMQSTTKEMVDIVRFAGFVSGKVELPEDENEVAAIWDRALDFFPIFNNYEKGMIGLKYGEFYSRHADPTVRATKMEALAKAALGVQSAEERDVTNMLRQWQGLYLQKEGGKAEGVSNTARDIFERTKKLAMQFSEGEIDRQQMADMLESTAQIYKMSLPEHEYAYIFHNYLPKRLMEDYNEETRSSELSKAIINGVGKGTIGLSETRARVMNVAEFEGKKDLVEGLDKMVERLNELKQNQSREEN